MLTWHIITAEYPPVIGGVSGYCHRVAEGLAAAGEDVHVWCPPQRHLVRSNSVTVHPDLGRISRRDLCSVDRLLESFPPPRRLLVEWVPHGFGYRSMNVGFCLWLSQRARRGDRLDIMVHEPYLAFGGGVLQSLAAAVHRAMTIVLARAAHHIWIAIPQWEKRWRPYALGRDVPFEWLPIPCNLPEPSPDAVWRVRKRYARPGGRIVGYLGSYGSAATRELATNLPEILRCSPSSVALLLGQNGHTLHRRLVDDHPQLAPRMHAPGVLPSAALAQYVTACDLLVQPYPDGISSRRTSAMAGLALGVPVVTTAGHLTESLWAETGCVSLIRADEPTAFASEALRLLSDADERRRLAARGRALYLQRFDVRHTIGALRRAAQQPCVSQS